MSNKIRQQIASKQAELNMLKMENETIRKLESKINDQLNRLKIEAMSFKSAIVDRDVKNAIQSSTSSSEVAPPNKPELVEQSFRLAAVTPLQVDQPQQINLVDLDLMVPPTGYLYNRETSDEDEEANECLLQL